MMGHRWFETLALVFARTSVRCFVPSRHREVLLGDLLEVWEERRATAPWRAGGRLAWDALSASLVAGVRGVAGRRDRRVLATREGSPDGGHRPGPGTPHRLLGDFLRDTRIAFRRMRRTPGFTAVAVASIALGVGGNTALFTLVNEVILETPPYSDPDQLVDVRMISPGDDFGAFSYVSFRELEQATQGAFEAVSGVMFNMVSVTDGSGPPGNALNELVVGPYFQTLGVDAQVGRVFHATEGVEPGVDPVVVLSDGYWRRAFAADPNVVGRMIHLNGHPYTVVGVAARGFRGVLKGLVPDLWAHASMSAQISLNGGGALTRRGQEAFVVKGRLSEGVSLAEASTRTTVFAEEMIATYPDSYIDHEISVTPLLDTAVHPAIDRVVVPLAALLMAVVAAVLLIACVNLAGFLLARAEGRRREIALKRAVGSGRGRLMRGQLTETLWLAVVGGVVGLGVARLVIGILLRVELPLPVPITLEAEIGPDVLAFTVLITLLATLVLGVGPALYATRSDQGGSLKDGVGRTRTGSARVRDALVVGQVAVSVVLLIGAGLFMRSLAASQAVDPGFGSSPAAIGWMELPPDRPAVERAAFFQDLLRFVGSEPSVIHVGLMTLLPLEGTGYSTTDITVPGVEPPAGRSAHEVDHAGVAGEVFEALGIEILEGRGFVSTDGPDSDPVAVVNQVLAERFWPGGRALGATFVMAGSEYRVVGVARTTKVRRLDESPRPMLYTSIVQSGNWFGRVVASTGANPVPLAPRILEIGSDLDPGVVTINSRTLDLHLASLLVPARITAALLGVLGALALLLAAIGLYGIVSHTVAARVQEMGIRMSVGARPGSVVRLFLGRGMLRVGLGVAVGVALAVPGSSLVRGMLFGVEALDPLTFVSAVGVLTLVGFVAAWVPAHRASRIDPVRALRAE